MYTDGVDPVKMARETVEIEGGRKLYNYTFEIEGEPELDESDPSDPSNESD